MKYFGEKMDPILSLDEKARYARNIKIPQVGEAGQSKLKAASVLIIGLGGLGSASALYLAAAGVGHIGLMDYDRVELHNLNRQVIHDTTRLGMLKVDSAFKRLKDLNLNIEIDKYAKKLTSHSGGDVISKYSIIIDGTDNFETRYVINDLCVRNEKTYIYGAVFQFSGQMSVFDAAQGPCFRCVFPEMPPAEVINANRGVGVMGTLPGTIATLQAVETIKIILGLGSPMIGRLLLYDALDFDFSEVSVKKNIKCPVCNVKKDDSQH